MFSSARGLPVPVYLLPLELEGDERRVDELEENRERPGAHRSLAHCLGTANEKHIARDLRGAPPWDVSDRDFCLAPNGTESTA